MEASTFHPGHTHVDMSQTGIVSGWYWGVGNLTLYRWVSTGSVTKGIKMNNVFLFTLCIESSLSYWCPGGGDIWSHDSRVGCLNTILAQGIVIWPNKNAKCLMPNRGRSLPIECHMNFPASKLNEIFAPVDTGNTELQIKTIGILFILL